MTEPPEILEIESFRVIGLSAMVWKLGPDLIENEAILRNLWQELREALQLTDRSAPPRIALMPIPRDQDAARSEYFAAVPDPGKAVPGALERRVVPAGVFAQFLHRGPMAELHRTYDSIYRLWLPHEGKKLGWRLGRTQEIVHYDTLHPPDSPLQCLRILIPLERTQKVRMQGQRT